MFRTFQRLHYTGMNEEKGTDVVHPKTQFFFCKIMSLFNIIQFYGKYKRLKSFFSLTINCLQLFDFSIWIWFLFSNRFWCLSSKKNFSWTIVCNSCIRCNNNQWTLSAADILLFYLKQKRGSYTATHMEKQQPCKLTMLNATICHTVWVCSNPWKSICFALNASDIVMLHFYYLQ